MNLKEFSDKIISHPEIWDLSIEKGVITIDDDISDEGKLIIEKNNILITTYYVNNHIKLI